MSDLTSSKFWKEAQHHTINQGVNVRGPLFGMVMPYLFDRFHCFFYACNKRSFNLITEEIMGVDLFHISDIN